MTNQYKAPPYTLQQQLELKLKQQAEAAAAAPVPAKPSKVKPSTTDSQGE